MERNVEYTSTSHPSLPRFKDLCKDYKQNNIQPSTPHARYLTDYRLSPKPFLHGPVILNPMGADTLDRPVDLVELFLCEAD
jgi:hypothetical protein